MKWHLPTPMPTSTINPREISDTISLFTENETFQPEYRRRIGEKRVEPVTEAESTRWTTARILFVKMGVIPAQVKSSKGHLILSFTRYWCAERVWDSDFEKNCSVHADDVALSM